MSIHTGRPLPWWVGGDLNAAFGLGFNVLVLTSLCVGVVQIPPVAVFGIILPALGIQLLIAEDGTYDAGSPDLLGCVATARSCDSYAALPEIMRERSDPILIKSTGG